MSLIPIENPGVPGAAAATPPTFPGQGSSSPGGVPPQGLQQLIQLIAKQAQQKQLPSPVPSPIPQGRPQQNIPNLHSWGFERFAQNVGNQIHQGVQRNKQAQLAKAESDWNSLSSAMQSGNQAALDAILTDPKKLKNMAKALNEDWLNPEKTSVYKDALNNVIKQQQAKGQAAQGMMATMKQLIQKAFQPQQQPNLNDDQKKQMEQQILAKAPTSQATQNPQAVSETMNAAANMEKAQSDMLKAQTEARQKYQIGPDAQGNLVAVNKSDPNDVVRVTGPDGKPVTGQGKAGAGTKPALVNGVPVGIYRNGQLLKPGDPGWTGKDQSDFASFQAATAASNAVKDHRMALASEVRAKSYAQTREYAVINTDTNQEEMVNADVINSAPKGTYASATGAAKVMNQQAIFKEIDYTSGQLNDAIKEMGSARGFDPQTRAQLSVVLRSTDPNSAWQSFLNSDVADTLTDPQIKYVTALVSMDESAMSLRSVAGQGQASDAMRNRISAMLPTAATPSQKYAERQMQLFTGELNQLRKGIPGLGKPGTQNNPSQTGSAPPKGAVSIGTSKRDGKEYYLDGSGKSLGPVT